MDLKAEDNVFKRGSSFCYLVLMEHGKVLIYILNTEYWRNERDAALHSKKSLMSL